MPTLRSMLFLLALMPSSVLAQDSALTTEANRPVSDLVVFSKVDNQELIELLDEFGMNSVITARLRITRVEKGQPPSAVVTIRYIAHSDLPEDQEFRFRLRRTNDGTYLVCREGGRGYAFE